MFAEVGRREGGDIEGPCQLVETRNGCLVRLAAGQWQGVGAPQGTVVMGDSDR